MFCNRQILIFKKQFTARRKFDSEYRTIFYKTSGSSVRNNHRKNKRTSRVYGKNSFVLCASAQRTRLLSAHPVKTVEVINFEDGFCIRTVFGGSSRAWLFKVRLLNTLGPSLYSTKRTSNAILLCSYSSVGFLRVLMYLLIHTVFRDIPFILRTLTFWWLNARLYKKQT